jgi:hypothetical protein
MAAQLSSAWAAFMKIEHCCFAYKTIIIHLTPKVVK